jgi:hypothetical protein
MALLTLASMPVMREMECASIAWQGRIQFVHLCNYPILPCLDESIRSEFERLVIHCVIHNASCHDSIIGMIHEKSNR